MIAFTRQSVDIDTEFQPTVLPALPEGFEIIDDTLHFQGIDLMALLTDPISVQGVAEKTATPLYVRRLESLRDNYHALHYWFWVAKEQLLRQSDGCLRQQKRRPSEPVVRTLLEGKAQHTGSFLRLRH
ncbi:MAG: hypothetical protein U0528_20215 [Anaerolineae bacterium]